MGKIPPSIESWIKQLDQEELRNISKLLDMEKPEGYIPYDVKIKLTFRCNAECYYCLHGIRTLTQPETYSKDILSTFELKHVISELSELGTKVITFSGGEPTLRSDLPDLVRHASKLGMRVKMTTNGSLITKKLAQNLASSGLKSVNISLDGIGDAHDLVRGKGMFERTWRGIKHLEQAYLEHGKPKLRLNHVLTSNNYLQLDQFLKYIDESDIEIEAVNLLFIETNHNSERLGLNHPKIQSILDQFLHMRGKINLDVRESNLLLDLTQSENNMSSGNYTPKMLEMPCYFPLIHMFIMPQGDVIVCCGAERDGKQVLGNIRDQPVKEVWNSEKYQQLRKFLKNNKFSFCLNCDHGIKINTDLNDMIKILEVV